MYLGHETCAFVFRPQLGPGHELMMYFEHPQVGLRHESYALFTAPSRPGVSARCIFIDPRRANEWAEMSQPLAKTLLFSPNSTGQSDSRTDSTRAFFRTNAMRESGLATDGTREKKITCLLGAPATVPFELPLGG